MADFQTHVVIPHEFSVAEDEVISGDEDEEPSDALKLAKGKTKTVS